MRKGIFILFSFILIACSEHENIENVSSSFILSSNSLLFDSNGGTQEISIETNVAWNILSSLPSWLSIEEKSNNHIVFFATSNDDEKQRNAQIFFSAGNEKYLLSITQNAREVLAFQCNKNIIVPFNEGVYSIKVLQNIPFNIKYLDDGKDWLYLSSEAEILFPDNWERNIYFTSDSLLLHVNENIFPENRRARVVIYNNTYFLSDTLYVQQDSGTAGKYIDGEYLQIQKASKGNVNLIVMGDGFTSKYLYENGLYEQSIYKAVDYFFSIEPYKSYREYFNVYAVMVESPEEGVGEKDLLGISTFENKFSTVFGSGTEITCNDELVFEYARKVKEISSEQPLTVIVVLNSAKYAGTTYLYSNGNSIALCPMSEEASPNDFEGLIHHEAGGHGFGFLCDEYVYYKQQIPENRKKDIKEWQELGFQMNLDFTNDSSSILWKDFIGLDKYKQAGAYEGGYEYQYGVWRSEENSCMNNNVPYFNVQSRWSIVRRIMQLSEKEITVRDFIENDCILPVMTTRTIVDESFKPLGEPIWIR